MTSTHSASASSHASWRAPLRQLWTSSPLSATERLAEAEARVLSRVKTPYQQSLVAINDTDDHINTIHFHHPNTGSESSEARPVVLLHGFGAGLGLYFGIFDSLIKHHPSVYAIDMLGCGRSSRPSFRAQSTTEAESFFVDSLEQWREKLNIDKMTLAGHSLGGYLGAVYALKYPERVERLILISPVGVPHNPADDSSVTSQRSLGVRALFSTIQTLHSYGVAPQDVVKWTGPYGRRLIDSYVLKRFTRSGPNILDDVNESEAVALGMDTMESIADVSAIDKPVLADYIHAMFLQKASGERALRWLLSPTAHALSPLIDRLPKLASLNPSIPVTLMYGTFDWMDVRAGVNLSKRLNQLGMTSQCLQVKGAGHQVFIDNAVGFTQAMKSALTFDRLPALTQSLAQIEVLERR